MLWLVFYFQLNKKRGFGGASEINDGFERNPAPYFIVYKHGLSKLQLLYAVIYFHLKVLHICNLLPEIRYKRECEVAVCYGSFKGAFFFGSFYIDMYPLMVEGGIGEVVDLFLGYFMPGRYADFFA